MIIAAIIFTILTSLAILGTLACIHLKNLGKEEEQQKNTELALNDVIQSKQIKDNISTTDVSSAREWLRNNSTRN